MAAPTQPPPPPPHLLFVLLLTVVLSASPAFSGEIVDSLPGFSGKLPFNLETGYVSVGDSEMFYYFIQSEGKPKLDPLLLWITGGPGCSSFNSLVYEIGPLQFDFDNYEGGLPQLISYPYSWTKAASIIFLDSPVGTGFSYSRSPEGWQSSDTKAANETYKFLMQWFAEHPEYLKVPFYVGGDGYSGIIVPLVTELILVGVNQGGQALNIKLRGYLVGSPNTDKFIDSNSKVQFAHRMALISDDTYHTAKNYCNENYIDVDITNTNCVLALDDYETCVKYIWPNNILEPKCTVGRPHDERWSRRRSLQENSDSFILSSLQSPDLDCPTADHVLSDIWANDEAVQDALLVRKGTVEQWSRCNITISYVQDVPSVVHLHQYFTNYGLRILVNVGDRDMVTPFVGVAQWIKSLNLSILDEWRPWFLDGQVAGYTRQYEKNRIFHLTYATVKGGGHTAAEYYRRECYEMFSRWVNLYPL